MRRITTLACTALLLLPAACGQPAGEPPAESPDQREGAFERRAAEVAEAWRNAALPDAWRTGYVPLQDATIVLGNPTFDDATKQAFFAGWYRAEASLPTEKPADGTIHFPDGTLDVPLVSAEQAYRQIAQGEPPPCPDRPAEPAPTLSGPDSPVSSHVICGGGVLTVTGATLGTATVRTSRGEAKVPAWLFTIAELDQPIARLAVDPAAITPVPEAPALNDALVEGLVSAQDLTSVEGTQLHYRLGVGACDTDIRPLVWESEEVVVVSGTVTTTDGICTSQLVLAPVTVTLDTPLGARPVLDAVTGQPLRLTGQTPSLVPTG